MSEFTNNFNIVEQGLDVLDTLAEYLDNALNANLISSQIYLRTIAGIHFLKLNMLNNSNGVPENEYHISLEHLLEINSTARTVHVDKTNRPVLLFMDKEEEALKAILKEMFSNNQTELTPATVDKLFNIINNVSKEIDEIQQN